MNCGLTSIDDPHRVGDSLRHVGLHPLPQLLVDLLSLESHRKCIMMGYKQTILFFQSFLAVTYIHLLWGSSLASANGPNRLISKHNLAPVLYIVCKRDM